MERKYYSDNSKVHLDMQTLYIVTNNMYNKNLILTL